MEQDPHVRRLLIEHEKLINLASRSDLLQIDPIDAMPGVPPDKYVITFKCKGIASINEKQEPLMASFHQVSMYISREFPRQEPHLKWLTPIWHPNIEHKEPHHVCTNNVQSFFSTRGLDDLIVVLAEMVQYKRYHAVWQPPWPLDKEAADWVVNYAEPNNIVGPDKPYDNRPLLRAYKIRRGPKPTTADLPAPSPTPNKETQEVKRPGITLGHRSPTGSLTSNPEPVRKQGISLGEKRPQKVS